MNNKHSLVYCQSTGVKIDRLDTLQNRIFDNVKVFVEPAGGACDLVIGENETVTRHFKVKLRFL